jgi:mediator of RNA polymerase II transcription subunit 7
MDEEETELRNPFPSPPSHYQNYTAHNLKLLSLLGERAEPEGIDLSNVNQRAILSDQSDVPEWPLAQLEKPRVDWILEEGHYTVFGDTWQVSLVPLVLSLKPGGDHLHVIDQGECTVASRTWGTPTVPY